MAASNAAATAAVGPLSTALDKWKNAGLSKRIHDMDRVSTDILELQQQAPLNRKRLAEMTKEFRRQDDAEKAASVGGLVKSYQSEIDSLTKRCNAVESEFLALYRLLIDLPDVTTAMSSALDALTAANSDRSRTSEQLRDTKAKVEHYESKALMEEVIQQKVGEREQELALEFDTKLQTSKAREEALAQQVKTQSDEIRVLQSSLNEGHSLVESEREKWARELANKRSEAEMTQRALDASERRVHELQGELENFRHGNSAAQPAEESRRRENLESLEQEIARLRGQLTQTERLLEEAEQAHRAADEQWQEKLHQKDEQHASLEQKLAQRSDYDVLKAELAVLKQIELGDAWEQTLQDGLLHRNRKLIDELTVAKNKLASAEAECGRLREQVPQLEKSIKEQQSLIRTLEEDLGKAQSAQTPDLLVSSASLSSASLLSPATSEPASASQQSMVKILTSQRDRFRQRNQELEEEMRTHLSTISDLRHQLTVLQEDNVTLYEKIKFLQNYNPSSGGMDGMASASTMSQRHNANSPHPDVTIEMDTLSTVDSAGKGKAKMHPNNRPAGQTGILQKYRDMYEDTLNPFAFFRKNEQTLRYTSLSGADKATLNISKFLLANKHTRLFLFLYSICLHVLVFATLYHFALSKTHDCPPTSGGAVPNDKMLPNPAI
ncbi:hypothetical protein RI367_005218 [Sorochytrium milnesiophthora]